MTTWVDLEGIIISEISREIKTNAVCFHLYVESKKQTNIIKQKQTHRYREQTSGYQKGEGWEEKRNS